MLSKNWVFKCISIISVVLVFMFPVSAFSVECSYDRENPERVIHCDDGKTYNIFPKQKAQELLKTVEGARSLERENQALNEKISKLEEKISSLNYMVAEQRGIIDFYEKNNDQNKELISKLLEEQTKDSLFENPFLWGFVGFGLASGSFGFWSWAKNK